MNVNQSTFHSVTMEPKDVYEGYSFSNNQRNCIQNLISSYAEEAVGLALLQAPTEETRWRAAYLKGQIDSMKYLLAVQESLLNPDVPN